MANDDDVILSKAQRLAFRRANLVAHNVGERHHLGDGMLDLDARVHFHEIEMVLFVQ